MKEHPYVPEKKLVYILLMEQSAAGMSAAGPFVTGTLRAENGV